MEFDELSNRVIGCATPSFSKTASNALSFDFNNLFVVFVSFAVKSFP